MNRAMIEKLAEKDANDRYDRQSDEWHTHYYGFIYGFQKAHEIDKKDSKQIDKLKQLMDKTKCSLSITVNAHRNFYETVEQHITEEDKEDIYQDVWSTMIKLDTCIRLQFYPDTPIGCYVIHNYDLEKAIDIALEL